MKQLCQLLLGVCLVLGGNALAEDSVWTSQRGLFTVRAESELQPLQINVLHGWRLHIAAADGTPVLGAIVEASGGMPQHNHGLPTRPRVTTELGDGDYYLEGMRFHMAGDWEVVLNIEAAGHADTVVIRLTL